MHTNEIESLLPDVFRQATRPAGPLRALLEVMEDLQQPSEAVLAGLDAFFDPRRCPDAFVPYLASWVALGPLIEREPGQGSGPSAPYAPFPAGLGRLRELVAAAAELSRLRGTTTGLLRFLHTATGHVGFRIEEEVRDEPTDEPRPYHFRVHVPAEARRLAALIERIVETEKPAYVTHELVFATSERGES